MLSLDLQTNGPLTYHPSAAAREALLRELDERGVTLADIHRHPTYRGVYELAYREAGMLDALRRAVCPPRRGLKRPVNASMPPLADGLTILAALQVSENDLEYHPVISRVYALGIADASARTRQRQGALAKERREVLNKRTVHRYTFCTYCYRIARDYAHRATLCCELHVSRLPDGRINPEYQAALHRYSTYHAKLRQFVAIEFQNEPDIGEPQWIARHYPLVADAMPGAGIDMVLNHFDPNVILLLDSSSAETNWDVSGFLARVEADLTARSTHRHGGLRRK